MRIRNWLLTGTSLAVLSLAPQAAQAQSGDLTAAYQAYVAAQSSGDSEAEASARQALTELCIVEGYASIDECIAALSGGGQPAAEPTPVEEPAMEESAPADEPVVEEQAAPEPQPEPEPAPAVEEPEQQPVETPPEPEPEPAPAEEPPPAPEQQPEAPVEEPAPAPEAEPAPPAAEQQQMETEQPQASDTQQSEDQFIADLQAALDDYQAALDEAVNGDYDTAVVNAQDAEARILELCTTNGYPDISSCIGQELPPLPDRPDSAQPAPGEVMSTPDEELIPEEPVDGEVPAEMAPNGEMATPDEEPNPEQPAEADPMAEAEAELATAVELYNVGVGQLEAGDSAGQSTIEAANKRFIEICAVLGIDDVAACLTQYGVTLPPVPETPTEQPDAQPPVELTGEDNDVNPETTEALPESISPEAAAPVLDSAKDRRSDEGGEVPPPPQPAEEQQETAPPPENDQSAQQQIAPVEVQSVAAEQGEEITSEDLPEVEVPQNVTVINNITTVNNTTTINNTTNNNTTINNNGDDGRPTEGGGRPRGDRDDRPNYTNSGFIFNIGVNLVISNPGQDFDRITDNDEDEVYYERLRDGRVKETVVRPNGVQIVTIRNRYGEVLKRSRITPDGREYILAYYDEDSYDEADPFDGWRDPGEDLPPLRLNISVRDYIIDSQRADEDDLESFFRRPPVEEVRRIYTIEEVKRSARIRDSVRRVEVGNLTFDSGAATIARTQVGGLSKVANAMLALLEDNPAETFLIEGHTDAVGSDQANLILSDARAATVARILTDFYDVPPENLVTQGYGERYLKVETQDAERLNRRVSIKRITPLITYAGRN